MKAKRGLRRLLSLAVMLCMILTMSLSAFATAPQAALTAWVDLTQVLCSSQGPSFQSGSRVHL